MVDKQQLVDGVDDFFKGSYDVKSGYVVPDVADIAFGKVGREMELAMLFIDIRESTKIVDAFRRVTAAKMYKSFLWGITKIARKNDGDVRSFNGDGVLVAFAGDSKRNNAVRAAMQMKWFCREILKSTLDSYFTSNQELQDLDFDFGIGIDCGKILIVRGGMKGENNNDLVWVGNATNYAVKLSGLSKDGYNIYISESVYKSLSDEQKFGGTPLKNKWESRSWNDMDLYRTNWQWSLG